MHLACRMHAVRLCPDGERTESGVRHGFLSGDSSGRGRKTSRSRRPTAHNIRGGMAGFKAVASESTNG
jgi:hypothetical protein